MKQIISYIEEPINYENRLRYIMANVLNMCCHEYKNLNLTHSIMDSEIGPEINWEFIFYNKQVYSVIDINMIPSLDELVKISFANTAFKFLDIYFNNMNIHESYHKLAIWIFALLHEIGHFDFLYRLNNIDSEFNLYMDYNNIKEINKLSLQVADIDNHFAHNISMDELLADRYAYVHFPRVWNELIMRGLI